MRRIVHIPESILQPAILLICLVSLAACDEGKIDLAPTASGTIVGQVTINGVGAAGVTVVLSSGQTATTGSTGGYTFQNVLEGAYTVSISGYPVDVSFPATVQAAVLAVSNQVVTVNFAGTRAAPPSGTQTTVTGTLTCIGGDTSHDPFVFNAGGGSPAAVGVSLTGNNVTITGIAGFAPADALRNRECRQRRWSRERLGDHRRPQQRVGHRQRHARRRASRGGARRRRAGRAAWRAADPLPVPGQPVVSSAGR